MWEAGKLADDHILAKSPKAKDSRMLVDVVDLQVDYHEGGRIRHPTAQLGKSALGGAFTLEGGHQLEREWPVTKLPWAGWSSLP